MHSTEKIKLIFVILIGIALIGVNCQLSPAPDLTKCQNLYDNKMLPQQCSILNRTCIFNQGLAPLIVNSSQNHLNQQHYSLCLFLTGYSLYITNDPNTTDTFKNYLSVYIAGHSVAIGQLSPKNSSESNPGNPYIQKSIVLNYNSVFSNNLIIVSDTKLTIQNASISARLAWLQAIQQITVQNSIIMNQSSLQSSCACYLTEQACQEWLFKFPQLYNQSGQFNISFFRENIKYQVIDFNSILMISYKEIIISSTQLKSSAIGIFSEAINVSQSGISTDGLGYASDLGQGCGFFDQLLNQLLGCTGSGGSHGGWGGNSSPSNCNLMISKNTYGNTTNPFTPGSGGGFFLRQSKEVSSGGGIIHIQTVNLTIAGQVNFTSDGNGGMTSGGGGSGGTVVLDYTQINNNGIVNISADGGSGKSSGGGGRIRYYNHAWQNTTQFPTKIYVSANRGTQCNGKLACGTNGSIFVSPCIPGYQINTKSYLCQPCPMSTYKITYGYQACSKCYYMPQTNAYYSTANTTSPSYFEACAFTCNQGFVLKDGNCLSEFQSIMHNIGGVNVLICLGIIIVVIILYLVVTMVRRMIMKEAFWSSYEQLQKHSSKKYFQVQDIPYHQIRLYLSGTNHPFDPWNISQSYSERIFQQSSTLLNRISHLVKPIFQKINENSVYNGGQKSFLIALKFYYYPMYRFVKDYVKASKARYIFQAISRLDQKIPQSQNISLKFHVKPNMTIGCIQIFDFTRTVYDYYIDNYLPVIFELQKMPLGDFTVDFTDPFLKALISSLAQGEQKTKQLMVYFQQLNSLLRCCQQVLPILSHLWTITQIVPYVQAYLWQPPDCVIGIDNQFKIDTKKKLFLMITTQKQPKKKHFLSENQFHSVHFNEIECLKHKFNLRKESTLSPQRKTSLWEINHQISQKALTWMFGIFNIIFLLLCIVSLFVIVFILLEQSIQFNYGVALFFFLLPFSDFMLVFLNFKAIIAKSHRIIAYAILFSLGVIIKYLILIICALVQMLVQSTEDINSALIDIIFGVWLAQFILGWINLGIQMMLNPLFLKSS